MGGTYVTHVEFIGGPYDGYREDVSHRPAEELGWLVCRDVFRLLDGKKHEGRGTITSVAIYELEVCDGRFQYQFVRAIPFGDLANDMLQGLADGT